MLADIVKGLSADAIVVCMIAVALLWALVVVAEALAYTHLPTKQSQWRSALLVLLLVLLVFSTALHFGASWRAWVVACLLTGYRMVNIRRFWLARLPEAQLRPVSRRALAWLAAMQLAVLVIGSAVSHWHIGRTLLDGVAAVQLVAALVLLRATTHTWRHAAAPPHTKPLTDRELPSVSVLVPARNETAGLEQCLQVLTASNYPKLEIVVLDDCSVTRRTPEIIRSFAQSGVRFVAGTPPDETRWLSKNWAYEQLAQAASGELLLFCGVDVRLQPDSIRHLVGVLETRKKLMLSVMPLRRHAAWGDTSLLQTMRYYWELCLPRRFFKRPPVLSSCWLIRRDALEHMGGFASATRSVIPEAPLARQAVVTDGYSFIRSDDALGVYSTKPPTEQLGTSIRVRYPQLHRRLELVAIVTLLELVLLLGPLIGLLLAGTLPRTVAYAAVWAVTLAALVVTYAFAAVGTRLTNPWYGWLFMPAAFVADIVVLHISLAKYEFGSVDWKGRNVCLPVMQLDQLRR